MLGWFGTGLVGRHGGLCGMMFCEVERSRLVIRAAGHPLIVGRPSEEKMVLFTLILL